MKKLFTNINFYILLSIALFIGLIILQFTLTTTTSFSINEPHTSMSIDYLEKDSAFTNFLNFGYIDDTISHKEFVRKKDSASNAENFILGNAKAYSNEGWVFGFFGIQKLKPNLNFNNYTKFRHKEYLDSSKIIVELLTSNKITKEQYKKLEQGLFIKKQKLDSSQDESNEKYYITLSNYKLNNHNNKFFIKDDKYYLEYETIDSTRKTKNGLQEFATYKYKEIPIRYYIDERNNGLNENKICIPITKKSYQIYQPILSIFLVLLQFIYLVIIFGIPLKIIINISKGNAFIQQNITYIKAIALAILIDTILSIIFPYIIHLYYSNLIPKEFVFNIPLWKSIIDKFYAFFLFAALLLLAKAFSKGKNLQTQSDLTI
ncbi:MAG: DUF2975 domain-containing protein [Bacteroidetes bacterium]|nr:DUF2975 domain-containing protein [Bacteroidota bacterium]